MATNIIPKPHETLMHKFVRANPFQRFNQYSARSSLVTMLLPFGKDDQGVADAWKNLPPKLFSKRIIQPIIDYVDDSIAQSNVIKPIYDLDDDLLSIRTKMSTAKSTEKQALIQQAIDRVEKFAKDHGAKFQSLRSKLEDLKTEAEAYTAISNGKGLAGLDEGQKEAVKKWVNHMISMCNAAEDPSEMAVLYKENRQKFVEADKEAPGISGAMQHFVQMAAGSDLRLSTRGKTGWRPIVARWPFIDPLRTALEGAKHNYKRSIKTGEDGILASRYEARYQDIEIVLRCLQEGYYNPALRTSTISDNPSGEVDNVERYGILMNIFYESKGSQYGQVEIIDQLAGWVERCYTAGREADAAEAIRRLNWRMGRNAEDTVPASLKKHLLMLRQGEKHWGNFVERLMLASDHSPELYGWRDMNQRTEFWTRWWFIGKIAPGQELLGTPGRIAAITTPKVYVSNAFSAWLWGGKTVPNLIPNKDESGKVDEKNPTKVDPKKPTKVQVNWRSLYRAPRNWLMSWYWAPAAIYKTAWSLSKPVRGHMFKGATTAAAIAGTSVGGLIIADQATGSHAQLASRVTGVALETADVALAPFRWGLNVETYALTGLASRFTKLVKPQSFETMVGKTTGWNTHLDNDFAMGMLIGDRPQNMDGGWQYHPNPEALRAAPATAAAQNGNAAPAAGTTKQADKPAEAKKAADKPEDLAKLMQEFEAAKARAEKAADLEKRALKKLEEDKKESKEIQELKKKIDETNKGQGAAPLVPGVS